MKVLEARSDPQVTKKVLNFKSSMSMHFNFIA